MDGSSNDPEADRRKGADLVRRAICCSDAADSDFSAVSAVFGRTMPQHPFIKDYPSSPAALSWIRSPVNFSHDSIEILYRGAIK
jgi:hypothetical protein